MVLGNRRLNMREIAEATNISNDSLHRILSENLNMKKLFTRYVSQLLTLEQKHNRMEILEYFKRDSKKCMPRFITVNET